MSSRPFHFLSFYQHVDVSHNAIAALANLSSLAQLRTLCLEANRIASVADAAQYLPVSLEVLTLGSNQVCVGVWVCGGIVCVYGQQS
jgi:Leucine-rich repeat (LRR) protein